MLNQRFLQKVLIFTGIILATVYGSAEAQIYLDKGKFEVAVEPGQYIADKVVISNSTDHKRKVKVYMEDYEYISPFDGQKSFHKAGLLANSDALWVSLSHREVEIEPLGQAIVTFTINVPEGIKGGYYGAMIFENVPLEEVVPTGTGIALITRIGMMVNLEVNGFPEQLGLGEFKMEDGQLKFLVTNLGEISVKSEGKFYIMDQEGQVVDRGDVRKFFLPATQKSEAAIDIKPDVPPGRHTIVLTMNLRNGETIIREIDFEKTSLGDLKMIEVRE